MTNLLSREEFLKPAKRRFRDVELPVCGGVVRIRSMFENEKEAFEASLLNSSGNVSLKHLRESRRRLICLCLVDAEGNLLLGSDDVDNLSTLDGADLARLQDACQEWVGFNKGDIENLVKNSASVNVED